MSQLRASLKEKEKLIEGLEVSLLVVSLHFLFFDWIISKHITSFGGTLVMLLFAIGQNGLPLSDDES